MTREELRNYVETQRSLNNLPYHVYTTLIDGIDMLEQELSRDMEEIKEVINCDADAETKCKMISNILTTKPHYFEEPFINKPCVSSEVCEHDKQKVLDKIRAEIDKARFIDKDTRIVKNALASGLEVAMQIIDKYKAESEVEDGTDSN